MNIFQRNILTKYPNISFETCTTFSNVWSYIYAPMSSEISLKLMRPQAAMATSLQRSHNYLNITGRLCSDPSFKYVPPPPQSSHLRLWTGPFWLGVGDSIVWILCSSVHSPTTLSPSTPRVTTSGLWSICMVTLFAIMDPLRTDHIMGDEVYFPFWMNALNAYDLFEGDW